MVLYCTEDQRTQRYALLFSTDCDIEPVKLYNYYKARFQIEFLFRDSKQFASLTHCQARRTDAITFQVNASLTAVSISKLQAFQTYGKHCVPFSMASLVRRAFIAVELDIRTEEPRQMEIGARVTLW